MRQHRARVPVRSGVFETVDSVATRMSGDWNNGDVN